MMSKQSLESFLHEQIPLSKAQGISVLKASDEAVELSFPLSLNRNHLGTAYGGSLSSLLILTGYTWVFQCLHSRGHHVHVLLQSCETKYLHPVTADATAIAIPPSEEDLNQFLRTFERKGLARLSLRCEIGEACIFHGEFVASKATLPALG